jgi:hypothetical protein
VAGGVSHFEKSVANHIDDPVLAVMNGKDQFDGSRTLKVKAAAGRNSLIVGLNVKIDRGYARIELQIASLLLSLFKSIQLIAV